MKCPLFPQDTENSTLETSGAQIAYSSDLHSWGIMEGMLNVWSLKVPLVPASSGWSSKMEKVNGGSTRSTFKTIGGLVTICSIVVYRFHEFSRQSSLLISIISYESYVLSQNAVLYEPSRCVSS